MRPPNAMDGVPAPISRISYMEDAVAAKKIVTEVLHHDLLGEDGTASAFWTEDMTWYGPVGLGLATSKREYEAVFLAAIRGGLSSRHLQLDVLTCEGTYCGAHGYLHGRNTGAFLGEPASNKEVRLRRAPGLHVTIPMCA